MRAKPSLTWIIPKCEGKGVNPGASTLRARVPKKETPINAINARGELAMLALAQAENRAYLAQSSSVRGRV
jgi:hypothetical protein